MSWLSPAVIVQTPTPASTHSPSVIWNAVGAQFPWFTFPLLGWGILLAVHGVYAFVIKTPEEIMIERELRTARR